MKDPANVRRGRLNKSRSKSVEREWGRALGNQKRLTDARGIRQPDLRVGPWDIEIKSRIGYKNLVKLMDEAVGKAKKGQTPVLGLEIRQGNPHERLVIMRRDDWVSWNIGTTEDDAADQ
jgi:hypothetical protein